MDEKIFFQFHSIHSLRLTTIAIAHTINAACARKLCSLLFSLALCLKLRSEFLACKKVGGKERGRTFNVYMHHLAHIDDSSGTML